MPFKENRTKSYYQLSQQQRINWLRLIRSQNVGPAIFRDLISHFGTAAAALDAIPELAKRGGKAAKIRICSEKEAVAELEISERVGARYIGYGERDYPCNLRNLESAPPLICLKGNPEVLQQPTIGIVGSRNASVSGKKIAHDLAAELGRNGFTIVSGFARGIDSVAHKASLLTGTAAVFAGGVEYIFPEENQSLAEEMVKTGNPLISEMPLRWKPRSKDFPRRNRIIAGLSTALVVVEAARRSGTLITARLANEAGRNVLAVPGSPLDPRNEGTNKLIRDGATLVTNAEDVIEATTSIASNSNLDNQISEQEELYFEDGPRENTQGLETQDRSEIIASLGPSPVSIDDIVRFTDLSISKVQLTLLEMSLAGTLERHPGGLVSKIQE
ncbi:MAG: DNA-processing protein DprA [Pseudomonadota bacterium]